MSYGIVNGMIITDRDPHLGKFIKVTPLKDTTLKVVVADRIKENGDPDVSQIEFDMGSDESGIEGFLMTEIELKKGQVIAYEIA